MKSDYTQFVIARKPPMMVGLTNLLFAVLLQGQGTAPKQKPTDYPVRAQVAGFQIATRYLVHSLPVNGGVVNVNDYLVVEVAIYPDGRETPSMTSGDFTLRINHRKSVLFAQLPGMVAGSIKYPDWEVRPTLEGSVGIGGTEVMVGRPQTASRFPGDPRPEQSRLPRPPKVPDQNNPTGEEKPAPEPVEVSIARSAFPEGAARGPVSGYLFFAFKGKTKSIRSLELLYSSPDGSREATLRLF